MTKITGITNLEKKYIKQSNQVKTATVSSNKL